MDRLVRLGSLSITLVCGCQATEPAVDARPPSVDASSADASGTSDPGITVSGAVSRTFSEGAPVGRATHMHVLPQPRPVLLWTVFRGDDDACAALQALPAEQGGDLIVLLRGSDEPDGTFLAPLPGTYPVQNGSTGVGVPLSAEIVLYTASSSSDPRPTPVPGASGTVHYETLGESGIRMHVDATLEDGTTVRGSLDMTWCELTR